MEQAVGIRGAKRARAFFEDDGGYTTAGMLLAMLLSVCLLLCSARLEWLNSNSGDIQFAADAAALAGQNVLAEYMVLTQLADAIAFSLGMSSLCMYGVSAVLACVPSAQSLAASLLELGQNLGTAQREFCVQARESLDALQKGLPYLCVLNSALLISANGNESAVGAEYLGFAIPFPLEGVESELPQADEGDALGDVLASNNEECAAAEDALERAQVAMDEAKYAAYLVDCGSSGRCLYERAGALAGLSGGLNPHYASVEGWNFNVAGLRMLNYYEERFQWEAAHPLGGSDPEALRRQEARKQFYQYAIQVCLGYYSRQHQDGSWTVHVGELPKGLSQLKESSLYSASCYPLSRVEGELILHCCEDCPACGQPEAWGSLQGLDEGRWGECPLCGYSIKSLEQCVSMSSRVDNGFEYHYERFRQAALAFEEASREYAQASAKAQQATEESLSEFAQALMSFRMQRYQPLPPGRYGCVCIVIDLQEHENPLSTGLLASGVGNLGPRVALSAAALAPDEAEGDDNVIASFFASLQYGDTSFGSQLIDDAMELWGSLLFGYSQGGNCLLEAVEELLDGLPFVGDGLSSWARGKLEDTLELLGLQPLRMSAMKPQLCNSVRVLEQDDGEFSDAMLRLRDFYLAAPGEAEGALGQLALESFAAYLHREGSEALADEYTVFELCIGSLTLFSLDLHLPDSFVDKGEAALSRFEEALAEFVASDDKVERWR